MAQQRDHPLTQGDVPCHAGALNLVASDSLWRGANAKQAPPDPVSFHSGL